MNQMKRIVSVLLKPALLILLLATTGNFQSFATEHTATSQADIARITAALRPGDNLILADGTWKDQIIVFRGQGTGQKPITLRAATPGKVVFSGKSSLTVEGEHLVVSGLSFKEGAGNNTITIKGNHCRLTETSVTGGDYKHFVRLWGTENRVDHCYLANKTSEAPTLQVEVEEKPNHHRIDHNHFGPRPPLGKNGGETIRIGYSHQSMRNSGTIVEHNLFDRCDGEIEIISNKSCENIYRYNTFLDCAGTMTLRHGNRCTVDGNFFIGHHKQGSGSIRIIGEEHTITNNYIDGVDRGGFWITAGVPDSPLNGYFQARKVLIAFNTVVDSQGPYLDLDAGIGTSNRSLRPEEITIANNLFVVPAKGTLLKGTEGKGFHWADNVAFNPETASIVNHQGITLLDPRLERGNDGLWRPSADSPTRKMTKNAFDVKRDIDGQARIAPFDVGCDQASSHPVINRPVKPNDVGPSWMNRAG